VEAHSFVLADAWPNGEEESSDQKINKLEDELAQEKQRTEDLEKKIDKQSAWIKELRRSKFDALKRGGDSAANDAEVAKWKHRYGNLRDSFNEAMEEMNDLIEQLEHADNNIETLRGKLRSVRSELEEALRRERSLQEENGRLVERIDLLLTELDETKRELEGYKERAKRFEDEKDATGSSNGQSTLSTPLSGSLSTQGSQNDSVSLVTAHSGNSRSLGTRSIIKTPFGNVELISKKVEVIPEDAESKSLRKIKKKK
jgi:chromosome segregation ATPase